MSPRLWRERLQDILEAVTEIQAFTQGINFEIFAAGERMLLAPGLLASESGVKDWGAPGTGFNLPRRYGFGRVLPYGLIRLV